MSDKYSADDQQELEVHMPKADQAYWEDKYRIEYREARKALRSVGGRGSIWDNGNDYEDQT